MSKTHTPDQVGKAVGGLIRERIAKFQGDVEAMRTRELRKSAPGVDVCPLCAEPDVDGECACTKAHKAAATIKNDPTGDAPLAMNELCKGCGKSGCGGCGGTTKAEFEGAKTMACPNCRAKKVKVRQDGKPVTHTQVLPASEHDSSYREKSKALCNGERIIKTDTDPSTLLFEDKDPKALHPSDKKAKKPKTPQVPTGAAGATPLGIKKDEAAPGAKLPKAGKPVKISKPGSGGQIVAKSEELRKDTMGALVGKDKWKAPGSMGAPTLPGMTPKKPAGVVGVAGKQPVGMGGGDATKGAPGMHPETAAGLADVKGAGSWKTTGLPGLKAKLGAIKEIPIQASLPGPAQKTAAVAAKPASDPAADLKADKKAAGIGFLNNLLSRFRKPQGVVGSVSGPVRSQASPYAGVRGMAALARSEACGINLLKSLGDCPMCGTSEHLGKCPEKTKAPAAKAKKSVKLPGTGLRVKNKSKKGEVPPQTEGLSSLNHNSRLLTLRDLRAK